MCAISKWHKLIQHQKCVTLFARPPLVKWTFERSIIFWMVTEILRYNKETAFVLHYDALVLWQNDNALLKLHETNTQNSSLYQSTNWMTYKFQSPKKEQGSHSFLFKNICTNFWLNQQNLSKTREIVVIFKKFYHQIWKQKNVAKSTLNFIFRLATVMSDTGNCEKNNNKSMHLYTSNTPYMYKTLLAWQGTELLHVLNNNHVTYIILHLNLSPAKTTIIQNRALKVKKHLKIKFICTTFENNKMLIDILFYRVS